MTSPLVYDLGMRTRFRGLSRRTGMLIRGDAGWAEWSPFPEYRPDEARVWWKAATEAADRGFPPPVRDVVAVNSIVPAVDPEEAHRLATAGGCTTAKVKVAEPGQSMSDDLSRVEAVRDALGRAGRIRIDANGAWTPDQAFAALRRLARFDLEYVEQPCRTLDELAEVRLRLARSGIDVPVAADESIRRSGDPEAVVAGQAADIAVLKVQPLGGVRRCLELAERLGLPVVVSSAIETSIGIRAGVALAAALPELPYACGLGTVSLLASDVVTDPLVPVNGVLAVRDVDLVPGDWQASDEIRNAWLRRRADLDELDELKGDR